MNTTYDEGLSHEAFKARGESGEYRPDLDRYFLAGMQPPPVAMPIEPVVNSAESVLEPTVNNEVKTLSSSKVKGA